nr:hypothetical protein Iba_chr03bCG3100 [Ipomoea batatas]
MILLGSVLNENPIKLPAKGKRARKELVVLQNIRFLRDRISFQKRSNSAWEKPVQGLVKCNLDAAIKVNFGIVIRDDHEDFVAIKGGVSERRNITSRASSPKSDSPKDLRSSHFSINPVRLSGDRNAAILLGEASASLVKCNLDAAIKVNFGIVIRDDHEDFVALKVEVQVRLRSLKPTASQRLNSIEDFNTRESRAKDFGRSHSDFLLIYLSPVSSSYAVFFKCSVGDRNAAILAWEKPVQGLVKCNLDAAIKVNFGIVIRDDHEGFLWQLKVGGLVKPLHA